ncbi:C40 family peptidase [Cellulomonas sp. ES6]|uniref:C40 family peptidase n=1 Tax=Cellulomonas sp. ES6 TaxID=3039384 RepID=UPI0024B84A0D|nr:C40 family peptidase [Cellulomonas sp. ES6]WHP16560.1 C40 family peptidase [Cellulomonas sp. ES6]
MATSGLAVSLAAHPASAAASSNGSTGTIDLSVLDEARALAAAAPSAVAPAAATWSFDVPAATAILPPPPPPLVVEESPAQPPDGVASRSTSRTEAAEPNEPAPIGAPPPASANGSVVVEVASALVGVPYVYGGTTPAGFDCSGFTSYAYAQVGISIPRTSTAQRDAGTVVSRDQAQPGDLIWSPGHIAIYAGGNFQVDAPVPGKSVQIREIWQSDPLFIRIG